MAMPPFLLAAALAFWGWRSGNYAAATVLAIVVEAPRWIPARFDLRHADLSRIATLCTAVFVGMLAWLFVTVEPPRTARAVLTSLLWLPAVLAPLLLAQQLSSAGRVPLSTLFRYLRKLKERDPEIHDPAVDLSTVYFALCLVAAGVPNERDAIFYGAVVVLVSAGLAPFRPAHARWGAWTATLVAAAALGFAAHRGLNDLQTALEDWVSEWFVAGLAADPYRSSTDLGAVGRLKMVESIVLRVYADPQQVEGLKLLHRASFTALHGKTWVARGAPMTALEPLADGTTWPLAEPGLQQPRDEGVRIVTRLDSGRALLALPAGTAQVSGMAAAAVKRNALGAVQAELGGDWAPYVAQLSRGAHTYAGPRNDDLQIPEAERAAFTQLAEELGIGNATPAEALRRVREHFAGFSYSTYREDAVPQGTTPLGDFVQRSRSGHCEYFAAASTLLLRAAGVPARYATGFAVTEHSPLEGAYVVRARHAHAWSRVYVDGQWIDVDTTPPSWIEEEARAAPPWQRIADLLRWAGFRWSQRGELQASPLWYVLLAVLVAVFAWRMLRGKRAAAAIAHPTVVPRRGTDSEFFELERRLAERFAIPRANAEPPGTWIARLSLEAPLLEALRAALDLHERYRFDPQGIDAVERDELRARCTALAAALD